MSWSVDSFYLVTFTVGFAYALVAGFFSGILGGDHDLGGQDVGDVGADGADLSSGDFSGSVHFSPLSPTVISTFMAFFGGSGIVYTRLLGIDPLISVLPALVTAIAAAAGVFLAFNYLFKNVQGGIEVSQDSLIGREAEVIITIPADGMGEIAFRTAGGRTNTSARSESGTAIPKNSIVTIAKIVGNVYIVRPLSETNEEKAAGAGSEA